uniref:RanBP2-type domain-containing protein n=1 Tax=Alexandrium monilatum TaxID=311494 RepID=A0A7S4QLW0_9DINO
MLSSSTCRSLRSSSRAARTAVASKSLTREVSCARSCSLAERLSSSRWHRASNCATRAASASLADRGGTTLGTVMGIPRCSGPRTRVAALLPSTSKPSGVWVRAEATDVPSTALTSLPTPVRGVVGMDRLREATEGALALSASGGRLAAASCVPSVPASCAPSAPTSPDGNGRKRLRGVSPDLAARFSAAARESFETVPHGQQLEDQGNGGETCACASLALTPIVLTWWTAMKRGGGEAKGIGGEAGGSTVVCLETDLGETRGDRVGRGLDTPGDATTATAGAGTEAWPAHVELQAEVTTLVETTRGVSGAVNLGEAGTAGLGDAGTTCVDPTKSIVAGLPRATATTGTAAVQGVGELGEGLREPGGLNTRGTMAGEDTSRLTAATGEETRRRGGATATASSTLTPAWIPVRLAAAVPGAAAGAAAGGLLLGAPAQRAALGGSGAVFAPEDWLCQSCGDHQFARNTACRKCGAPKPTRGSNGQVGKAGDWICPNPQCKDLQFERNTACRRCGTPKPAAPEPAAGAGLGQAPGAALALAQAPPLALAGVAAAPAVRVVPGAMAPEGDWICANCGDHQFARNLACRKCSAPKPVLSTNRQAAKMGDWICPNPQCRDVQFEKNQACRRCGTAKPAGVAPAPVRGQALPPGYALHPVVAGHGRMLRPGDWTCPNPQCRDVQFERNEKCRLCGTAKPHVSTNKQVFKAGDWICPNPACGDVQFERNAVCRQCGTAKPSGPADGTRSGRSRSPVRAAPEGA